MGVKLLGNLLPRDKKMLKRKFDVILRKVGNSYVVTIPKDTVDRFKIKEGDYITVNLELEAKR